MNRIDRKKIQSLIQSIIRFFRRERTPEPHFHTVLLLENSLADFTVSPNYAVDFDARKSSLMALIEAERQKAEAIEKARRLSFR